MGREGNRNGLKNNRRGQRGLLGRVKGRENQAPVLVPFLGTRHSLNTFACDFYTRPHCDVVVASAAVAGGDGRGRGTSRHCCCSVRFFCVG